MYKIPATTLFLGKNLIFMPECHSTNDTLLLLCQKENLPEGTLVITSSQTAGRGQRGNVWEAEKDKNLTFSFLLKPSFLPVIKQFYLNIFVSLGIRDFLTEITGEKVHIKWPNDILLREKKISGILIETQLHGTRINSAIVGVGININQHQFTIPSATSLSLIANRNFDLPYCLEKLVHAIEIRYMQLRENRLDQLRSEFVDQLFRKDVDHFFYSNGARFSGEIKGIDDIGRLLIRIGDLEKSFDIKDVKYDGF